MVVLDFMNAKKAIDHLKAEELITKQSVDFEIHREVVDSKILKHIRFDSDGHNYAFTESVQTLLPTDFDQLFDDAGFTITSTFGNYDLQPFDLNTSNRYIVIAHKKQ